MHLKEFDEIAARHSRIATSTDDVIALVFYSFASAKTPSQPHVVAHTLNLRLLSALPRNALNLALSVCSRRTPRLLCLTGENFSFDFSVLFCEFGTVHTKHTCGIYTDVLFD